MNILDLITLIIFFMQLILSLALKYIFFLKTNINISLIKFTFVNFLLCSFYVFYRVGMLFPQKNIENIFIFKKRFLRLVKNQIIWIPLIMLCFFILCLCLIDFFIFFKLIFNSSEGIQLIKENILNRNFTIKYE